MYVHVTVKASVIGALKLQLCFLTGRVDNEKMKQLEEKIQSLTKNLQDLQSAMNKPSFSGGGGSSGGRNPADAAQPEIKETIHSIQTKLDQLDNRTQVSPLPMSTVGTVVTQYLYISQRVQTNVCSNTYDEGRTDPINKAVAEFSPAAEGWLVHSCLYVEFSVRRVADLSMLQQAHDKTLVSINNHLVNGKGNKLEEGSSGGGLNSLKEEILRELERRVSLSCSSCQVSVLCQYQYQSVLCTSSNL